MEENIKLEIKILPVNRQNFLHIFSLVLGVLAAWPYPILLAAPTILKMNSLPVPIGAFVGVVMLIIAPCNGIPFGFAGAITGIFALVKRVPAKRQSVVIVIAIIGLLLSIAGIISNIWYFTHLTPWNSVPQQ
jgi:hypothetical protein